MSRKPLLRMEGISKSFPGVQALSKVNFRVDTGSVHALMGENGAGKSTLMKILIGIYQPDEGDIYLKNTRVVLRNTYEALQMGISMIHQELNPVLYRPVYENIFLGREPRNKFGLVDHKKLRENTQKLFRQLDITINPAKLMIDLSVANRQIVEIAKAISYDSDLIIMDEPTSAITEREVDHLFRIITELKEKDVAVIFITHKMDEVFRITDEVTVFRDGLFIDNVPTADLKRDKLVQMMVGRELSKLFPSHSQRAGEEMLRVEGLSSEQTFQEVSFSLRKGEILGVAGLVGAGRTEVMETIFGIRTRSSGKVYIEGKEVNIRSPKDAIKYKMAFLTEDRKLTGLYLMLSVKDNVVIANIDEYAKGGFLNHRQIEEVCMKEKHRLSIKTPHLRQLVMNLSGGNQQKVLVSRWLLTDPDVLILDEPTRGIDVAAKAEIHKIMCGLAERGKAIVMISSELPEVLGMSDRIIVMHEGRCTGEVSRAEATQEKILEMATGI